MSNNKFLKSSAILFSGEFLTRLLGFIYISPLYAINSYVGVINSTIMIPYATILLISALGLGSALNQQFARNLNNPIKYSNTFFDGMYFILFTGTLMTVLMIMFSDLLIANSANSDPFYDQLVIGFKILAISIIFYCINTLLKSALISQNDLSIVSFTYVSEQVVKIIIVFAGAIYYYVFNDASDVYMIYAFSLSVTLSVISTTIIIIYHIIKHKNLHMLDFKKHKFSRSRMSIIISISIVFFVNNLYMTGFTQLDQYLFSWLTDFNPQDELELFTIYFNNVMKLINLPIVLGAVFITLMTRQISLTADKYKFKVFNSILDLQIFYSMLSFVFFCSAGLLFYFIFWQGALPVGQQLLLATAILIPAYLIRVIFSVYVILRKEAYSVLKSTLILFVLKFIFDIIFVKIFEINGFAYASVLAIIISTILLVTDNKHLFNFSTRNLFLKGYMIIKFILLAVVMYYLTVYLRSAFNFGLIIDFIIVSLIIAFATLLIFFREIKRILRIVGEINEIEQK